MKKPGKYQNKLSLKNKIGRLLWQFTWFIFYWIAFLPQFNFVRIWLLRLFGAKIGKNCKIDRSVKIWAPWNLELGNFVAIGFDVQLYNPGKIIVGNHITISQRAHLCSASHDYNSLNKPLISESIYINDMVWIAADVFVGMGVTIGEGAILGARSCVFKDVEQWTIVGGNPASFIKKREKPS